MPASETATRDYTIILPDKAKPFTDVFLLALCAWREARGDGREGMVAVCWTVRNRVEHPSWYGKDWFSVITKPYQFSSFNKNDANVTQFGAPEDPSWITAIKAAFDVIVSNVPDPTDGATFYYATSMQIPPPWANEYIPTVNIGGHRFFKPKTKSI